MALKRYVPTSYVPTTSVTGSEGMRIFRGENMWIRISRFGDAYAEGYTGNRNLSETIATKTLAGTLAWDATTKVVTGSGTAFIANLREGQFVLGDGGAGQTELFVVEKVTSNTIFTCSRSPTTTLSGKTGYVLPVIFPIGNDRGTAIKGNVIQYSQGHYLGVGDGTFRVNGSAINATLALSETPQFALYNPTAGTYTIDDVGIDKVTTPITVAAVTIDATITGATNATPIVITVAGSHGLYNGQTGVVIAGVGGNTAANGTWTITRLTAATFSLNTSIGNGAYTAGGTITGAYSPMRAGDYNVRVCAKNATTLGFSQPSDVIAPVTLTAGQAIRVTFNSAMFSDQDAYDIYCTPFEDNSTTTIEARYMGPWFKILGTDTQPDTSVYKTDLIDNSHATGTETGTTYIFSFADAEAQTAQQILTFNNFIPKDAEFVDLINGIPLYFSCQGKGNVDKTSGTSPGPACIPSKPSNPEAVFLNKTITTAGGDYILGEFNAKSRIYVLCQNTLQTLILTTLEDEPITFRSLWNAGFRNPYNVAFVKEYLYGFSTQKIVRSVAGGDDSAMEFEFTTDVRETINDWETGHVLVGYDPKNRAVVFFYSAAERRSGYWVTIALPFLLDKQVWNPPIILKKANQDFIVSGVATVGEELTFLAGGRLSGGSIQVDTFVFDGGDSETKDWYLAWNYSDDGEDTLPKTIKGHTMMARFANTATLSLYGIRQNGAIDITNLESGANPAQTTTIAANTTFGRNRLKFLDWGGFSTYTMRLSGSYTTTVDRLDELAIDVGVNNSET